MDAYIQLTNLSNAASLDPKHANVAALNRYLTGKAKPLFDENFSGMKLAGQAYRGSPADPRVKVQSVVGSTVVLLTSCPLASSTDPFTEYDVATGEALPVQKRTPPPPYKLVLTMVRKAGNWQLSDLLTDASRTCTG